MSRLVGCASVFVALVVITILIGAALRSPSRASVEARAPAVKAVDVVNAHDKRIADLRERQAVLNGKLYVEREMVKDNLRDGNVEWYTDAERQKVLDLISEKRAIDSELATAQGRSAPRSNHIEAGESSAITPPADSEPVAIRKVEAEYSDEARRANFNGDVTLSIVIDENGDVQDVRVIGSPGLGLDEKAIDAVRRWKFRPAVKNGVAVPTKGTVSVTFRRF